MTAKNHLHALAVASTALALIAGTAEAACTPMVQATMNYGGSGPEAAGKPTELTAIPNGEESDARKGRVLLTVLHDASPQLDGARFYAGRFIFNQG